MPEVSRGVIVWWVALSTIAVFNIIAWFIIAARSPATDRFIRWQRALCAGYVFVCAFRSFLPRADVQRICLVDSWWSTVLVGRFVATIGELCFMAQASLFLYVLAKREGVSSAATLAKFVVPLIALAETCSWYAVVTTNFLGNTLEESLWTVSALVLLAGFALMWPKRKSRVLLAAYVVIPCYVAFMLTVDVPMYFNRWRADLAAGRTFLGLRDGLDDLAHRWVVTFSWEAWHTEIPWMTAYFSLAVWVSLALFFISARARR